eukprot:gnl/MRDRNA2_/MRDRNA2_209415_c0_seq1.p1 gnl/MRDRNA2_/MRDRNA2_209415_c0~~gnl/MRDRNA2_/MRDRNA2_209415_c0_seq1.p1  ORF type:complete len:108 (+),score=12.78 gnl/MRDRNA2_/MRDRNA2_209415_c0_seq1:392-715(+)
MLPGQEKESGANVTFTGILCYSQNLILAQRHQPSCSACVRVAQDATQEIMLIIQADAQLNMRVQNESKQKHHSITDHHLPTALSQLSALQVKRSIGLALTIIYQQSF